MKISVTTPTFGRHERHPHLYKCFADQDWPDTELVVLDDSPSPSAFFQELDDPRVRYVHHMGQQNVGAKRNRLLDLSEGDLVAHFDDDDYYAPTYLSRMVEWLGEAAMVRLAGWFVYSQAWDRLWYWDQSIISQPAHFRLLGGQDMDAVPVHNLSPQDQASWITENLSGWGFSFLYRREVARSHRFEEVVHGEEGAFTRALQAAGHKVVQAQDTQGVAIVVRHEKDNSNLFPQYALPEFVMDRLFGPEAREFVTRR